VEGIGESSDACVVNQDVEASKAAIDAGCSVFELVQHGDIAGDYVGFSGGVNNLLRDCVEGALGASAEYGGGSHACEFTGDGRANAASSAGDDCDLPDQGLSGVHKLEVLPRNLFAANYLQLLQLSAASAARILTIPHLNNKVGMI
jgi:hypothetical protein